MPNNAYGIDLGTSTIKVYNSHTDSVLIEKNLIAIENKNTLLAYGDSAFEMFEKAPSNIHITFPLNNGVIADIKNMQLLLKHFLLQSSKNSLRPSEYYIAVPTDVTEVEKRAFYDVVRDSGVKAKKIMVVDKAIADGLGQDIDVKTSQGILMVNVGYHTTEISILSLGGIVLSRLIKIGGQKFDDAIRACVRKEFGLLIGEKTAERLKISLKDLQKENQPATVYGRDIVTGLPMERQVPTQLIDDCFQELFSMIIDNIKIILERTPPELSADIYRRGLYLSGGSSQVNHLDTLISQGTGLRVNMSANPNDSVVRGLEKIIKEDRYRPIASSIEGMRK